jgi:lactoylglutathione lyase
MSTVVATRFTTGHIGLNVSDLDRSKRFYQQVFGFEVLAESKEKGREYAFLAQGEKVVLTLWQQSGGNFTKDRPGLHHLSFQVDSVDRVWDAERRLREMDAVIHHHGIVPHREGAESGGVFFEDPDGIRLEIFTAAGVSEGVAPHGAAPTCGFF